MLAFCESCTNCQAQDRIDQGFWLRQGFFTEEEQSLP